MIRAENVTKIFTGRGVVVRAVDNVSTTVEKGEVVVVIGPSGSGKSTFIRCINALEMFNEGHVYIDGVDIADKKTNINKIRAEVGMVFQQFNLFPHKTVLENLTLAGHSMGGQIAMITALAIPPNESERVSSSPPMEYS